jgi:succinoglycan biosynthesis transport protein ExoP
VIEQPIEQGGTGNGGWVVNHLPSILKQRWKFIAVPFVLVLLAAVIGAYSLPTLYRSSATMLVETADLPAGTPQTPGASEIEQRIARIREQVLSRGDLINLIQQNDLYPAERGSEPMSKIVEEMRKATTVGALQGDIGADANNDNVIAIKLDYDYSDPQKAQSVMQAYVDRFLRMDSEQAEDQANLAVRFLQDQAVKLRGQIQQIEGQITSLKASNGAALVVSGTPAFVDTGTYSAQIASLENQNRQLLAESRGATGNPRLAEAEAALSAAQATYSDSHPDVVQARERLAAVRRAGQGASGGPDAAVQEQIRANNSMISQLNAARNAAVSRANSAMAGQARAPAILERAMQLESQASTLREQFKSVADDLLKAQSQARLANEQRGERLSLVEPPSLPDTPHWPNRPIMIAAGAALGLFAGMLLAMLVELLNRPMRSPSQLEAMGLPVLGVVPILDSKPSKRPRRMFKKRALSLG